MLQSTEKPVFIYHTNATDLSIKNKCVNLDEEQNVEKLIKLANIKHYKLVVLTHYKKLQRYKNNNVLILCYNNIYQNIEQLARECNNILLKFISS